jgi:two-component system sensor histidine kinase AlgZ
VRQQADNQGMAAPAWLPDFCSIQVLFAVMVMAELVVLLMAMAPSEDGPPSWTRLGSASLFVQWLGLIFTVGLCKLRPTLLRLPPWVGELAAYLFMLGVTAAGSALVFQLDHALGLHLTPLQELQWHFVLRNTLVCALIAAALLRYFYVQEQWRERVRAEARARFEALQARIRPHFLFNSMNTIASLIRTRPAAAETAVEDLADLFRASLGKGEGLRTLGEELDLAHGYLRIEQLRLGDRLRVDWEVAALPRDAELPPLLLQPLVENAVYHGIQPLAEGGTVSVSGRWEGDELVIAIANPCPLPADRRHSGNGMALANIRARIAYHFGERGRLLVTDTGVRFECTVRLPWELPEA